MTPYSIYNLSMLTIIVIIHISRVPKKEFPLWEYDVLKVLECSNYLWNQMDLQIELPCSHWKGFTTNCKILGLHAQNQQIFQNTWGFEKLGWNY
jgi:hypothetical protein